MSEPTRPISNDDLHDYIDGRLDPVASALIARRIADDPELAKRASAYRAQADGMHGLYDGILDEPTPSRLLETLRDGKPAAARARPRRILALAASFAACVVAGGGLGWWGNEMLGKTTDNLLNPFVQQAVLVHRLSESEAPQSAQFVGDSLNENDEVFPTDFLSPPFQTPLRAVTLSGTDFRPVALKTINGPTDPAMQFLYEDAGANLVSLYVRSTKSGPNVPFQSLEADGHTALFWLDGPLVYVLVGQISEAEMLALARKVYQSRAVEPVERE